MSYKSSSVDAKRRLLSLEKSRLEKARADFLAITSHELRSPLAMIQGYTLMLCDMAEAGRLEPEEAKTIVQGIVRGTRLLREIIENALDIAAIEAGTLELTYMPVSLMEVIGLALQDLQKQIAEYGHVISLEGSEGLPRVEGDATRLRQAFRNTLHSFMNHLPDGRRINISVRLVSPGPEKAHVRRDVRGQFIEAIIAEAGAVSAAEVSKFELGGIGQGDADHRPGAAPARSIGSDLGFAVARGIVEGHGGQIRVERGGPGYPKSFGAELHILLPVVMGRSLGSPPFKLGSHL